MYACASKCKASRVVWTTRDKMVQQKDKADFAFKKEVAVAWFGREKVCKF